MSKSVSCIINDFYMLFRKVVVVVDIRQFLFENFDLGFLHFTDSQISRSFYKSVWPGLS